MSDSVRALRKTYGRLHTEDHVNNETAILVSLGEKFTAENKILRIENKNLRDIIFEKKCKRKRNKSLNFYKESE
jgi:regulator of replication initiation timing